MMTKQTGIWAATVLCALQAQAATIYVDLANTNGPVTNGTSWATAWPTIALGVTDLANTNSLVRGGHRLWVNAGAYPVQTVAFTLAHAGTNGATNVFLANGVVAISGNSAISVSNASHFVIDGFALARIYDASAIFPVPGISTNIVIQNCGLRPWGSVAGVTFGGDSAIHHTVNLTIRRCVITNTADANFGINLGYLDEGTFENCTIVGMDAYGIRSWGGAVSVKNSIVAGCGYGGVYLTGATVLSNNCFFGNGQANVVGSVGYNTTAEINSIPNCSGNISANPGFSAMATFNFNQFYADSPCLNAGIGGLDMGAYENPPTVPTSANTYYVKNGGNDNSDGLSLGTAWATISKAANVAIAGDTVLVQPGIYTNLVTITNGGSGTLSVTYKADGAVLFTNKNFNLSRVAGVVLDGFECTRAIKFANAFGNTIRNGSVYDSNDDGIYFNFSNGNIVERMRLFKNTRHGVYGLNRVGNWFTRCSIYSNTVCGLALGVSAWEPCSMSHIWNCNIYSNGSVGVWLGNSYSYVILKQDIANCDIVGNGGHGVYLADPGTAAPANIRNCILRDNLGGGIWEGNAASDAYVSNNCFYANNGTNFYDEGTTVRDTQADINAAVGCGSNIVADPLMQGPDVIGGFRLAEASPCLNAGVSYPVAITDYYGNAHGLRNGWDIGSAEWYPPKGAVVRFR